MSHKEIDSILLAINAAGSCFSKYPAGNIDLTNKLKTAENLGLITYDRIYDRWIKTC